MKFFDPGLGRAYRHNTQRVINKDGTFNIRRTGIRKQPYQSMLRMSATRFFTMMVLWYLAVNIAFSLVYLLIGVEHLEISSSQININPFLKALFFSMQTFTTVGFGSIFPTDPLSNFVSGMEAMAGWIFFALATGLVYGRFSRPSARILFSNNALISPYQDGKALMFRIVNRRPNILMEMDAKVMLTMDVDLGKEVVRRYYNLKLETSSIHFFPLSWTLVHPLDESSPFHGLSKEELAKRNAEVLILIKGFDDTFSQHVHVRFSYVVDEIVWNARFIRNFYADEEGLINLDIDRVHEYEKLND
ncbi:K+ channel, inward rectifier [bacterium]|nr:K+ channel, inward rectifier [bacterium]